MPEQARPTYSEAARSYAILAVFTICFLAQAALRASSKFFWFDELCTLYISKLPTFGDSWQAVLHGADYNPPLFYVIMRAVVRVFGDGLIAFRIPAMVGVWVLCVTLFWTAKRHFGLAAGCVALLFPLVTLASYYAIEARPHGIVIGLLGAAILAWDWLQEKPASSVRAVVFGFCLLAAFLNHCYAVVAAAPFALSEIVVVRRFRWRVWCAVVLPVTIAAISYLPLLTAYRHTLAGTGFAYQFRAGLWQLPYFYLRLLSPAVLVGVAALIVFVLTRARTDGERNALKCLATFFALLPVAGLVLAMAMHGPFISRYFLGAAAGVTLLVAALSARLNAAKPVAWIVAVLLAGNFGVLAAHRYQGRGETLREPALDIPVNTTPGKPLASYAPLLDQTGQLPVVTADPMDFLYLYNYAPELRGRLYYTAGSSDESNYRLYQAVARWCHIAYNAPETNAEFLQTHSEFYVLGDTLNLDRLEELARGRTIVSFTVRAERFLAKVNGAGRGT